ncbi:MAG: carbohydrate kinase family protein [Aquincola tertiaricarbonis]
MFVVCGEALFDVFAAGDTSTGLTRLGQPVGFFGGVSTGFLGERLMRALTDEGVDTRCTPRSPARTTLSLVGVDTAGVPSYSFYGEGAADRGVAQVSLGAIPPEARAFHVGSYATVVEPVAATQRALIEREHRRSLISYDPNIRLNVEPDLGRWHALLDWMLPRTHLLKVSDEDLGLLFPGKSPDVLAAQWLARGVAMVVVTRGGEGALAWTAAAQAQAAPVKVDVVDTVGAGDTFQAALLTWLAEHDALSPMALRTLPATQLKAALDFAAQAAAITCSRRGADLPRRAELPV